MDGGESTFSNDKWGSFLEENNDSTGSGGITRVIENGSFIEKGACSITLIQNGILSAERAKAIRGRRSDDDDVNVAEGDKYSAAALSIVLHTRSPMVPTFRSDVRIFMVTKTEKNDDDDDDDDDDDSDGKRKTIAWFGGGADLTPYYLFEEDIRGFHCVYRDLCNDHFHENNGETYAKMKQSCDNYFYLVARSEHRGTGGIFFDDMEATTEKQAFVQGVADSWMPSWLGIVSQRRDLPYTDKQREWQLLRRGRYLEFNLLYDRGVRFGLANANPRIEGVMVSAPPLIAWSYNHQVEENSEEAKLMEILKTPKEWA
eukprot:CAMPEP_0195540144 /NCGR_PEP_ID=MMETSP0794_2-20130614/50424_1 /TAXON_ID=515487 /ORGANISM="Stephanopyxis turris, Strain CCMP 815" /LENGTH=314 /DNA_ID=CAMNT_0040674209 /DNA_START=293 /DNA_END=1237 /DNA_ORIENTATION=+